MELLLVEFQKSKRRLLSQKLGCSETTRVDLRNRRGVCFLKSWDAQRPRGSISEIEEAFAFSKAGLLKDHEGRSQKSKRLAFSKAGLLRNHEGRSQKSKRDVLFQPCQHLSHAHSALRKLWVFCRRFLVK
ncbi:hypothetical protein ACFX2K_020221 [Malus domestica]